MQFRNELVGGKLGWHSVPVSEEFPHTFPPLVWFVQRQSRPRKRNATPSDLSYLKYESFQLKYTEIKPVGLSKTTNIDNLS